jgi:ATP-dependent RNA helicase RhlE
MNDTDFAALGLQSPILKALTEEGYERPTPIQAAAIPSLLEGRDLLGCAQTGTGKTAAFALPIIQLLAGKPVKAAPKSVRALVVAPTRELAAQIDESFGNYARHMKLSRACVFGGVGKSPQEKALIRGVDVLTATPGRLLDLHGEGKLRLDQVEIVVLDEADRMLDMGFIRDVRRIVALLPKERQTLLFSATMPPSIAELAHSILKKPLRVDISPEAPTVELIEQSVLYADKNDKRHLLAAIIDGADINRALVFTRTKHGADRLVKSLEKAGITSAAIHANKSQNNRTRTLENFRSGKTRILVATDLAARGIDVDGISHVFNFELPNEPETYVHRIGRTARAGADGIAIAFCDGEEKPLLRAIEKLISKKIPTASGALIDEAFKAAAVARAEEAKRPPEVLERERQRNEGPRRNEAGRRGAYRNEGREELGRAPVGRRSEAKPAGPARPARTGGKAPSANPGPARRESFRKDEGRRPAAGTSRTAETPRTAYKPALSGKAPRGSSESRANHDAIRNAIRDIARGEDDLLRPQPAGRSAAKAAGKGNPRPMSRQSRERA